MAYDIQAFSAVLKNNGYSFTQPRKAVFNALYNAEALSIHELTKLLPTVDRASIYRTTELFEALGIIHRIQIGWKYKLELSDMFRAHHHHAVCTNCGSTIPVHEDPLLEQHIQALGTSQRFKVTSHTLELRGLCQPCTT